MPDDSGYVLRQEAVRRFVKNGLSDRNTCKFEIDGNEDVEIGNLFETISNLI